MWAVPQLCSLTAPVFLWQRHQLARYRERQQQKCVNSQIKIWVGEGAGVKEQIRVWLLCVSIQVCVVKVYLGFSVSTGSFWNCYPNHTVLSFCASLSHLGTNFGSVHVFGSVWVFSSPLWNRLLISWTESLPVLTFCPFPVPGRSRRRRPYSQVQRGAGRRPGCESGASGPLTDDRVRLRQGCQQCQKLFQIVPSRRSEKHLEPLGKAKRYCL